MYTKMTVMESSYLMLQHFQNKKYKYIHKPVSKQTTRKYPSNSWFNWCFGFKKTYVTFNDEDSIHILSQLGSRDSVYSTFRLSE
jgi:hypothetical protein